MLDAEQDERDRQEYEWRTALDDREKALEKMMVAVGALREIENQAPGLVSGSYAKDTAKRALKVIDRL